MKVSTDFNIKQAFILKAAHLKEIWDSLNTNIGDTTIQAYCEDGVNRNFDSLTALLTYSNPRNATIRSITFRARSDNYDKSARIVFANDTWGPIRWEAEGPESIVVSLKDDFLRSISRTKAWYDWLARLDIFWLIYGIGISAYVILLLLIALRIIGSDEPKNETENPREQAIGGLIGFGAIGSLAFVGLLISRIRTRLFPIGTFLWGDAAEHHVFLEKIRWTVIVGFIVSLLAGIVGSIVINLA
ncbi:MAG: hypothetical protein ACFFCW_32895 [Candidatus Hodarchaeota archaeon]